ncbi:MAG: ACT domain-containing protein [Desulfobacterales bacterium]|jgi:glycine cleavage system transcriptional repressor
MSTKFLLTAFCKDRPGVVAAISQLIYENGCNLEDSAMTSLADEFAMILLVAPLSGNNIKALEERLIQECRRLERDEGITAFIRPVVPGSQLPAGKVTPKNITVEGLDQAGIVYKVSRYLADQKINITKLNTRMVPSPESGAALYHMELAVQIPAGLSLETLESGLAAIGDALNVDIRIA